MALIHLSSVVFLLTMAQISMTESDRRDKLKISVFYESLCPDCIGFIVDQVKPTVEILKDHLDVLTFDLVPYGKVRKVGNKLHCQHGTRECERNKLNACIIDQLITQRQASPLQHEMVNVISCILLQDGDALGDAKKCLTNSSVNFSVLAECFKGSRGEQLIVAQGERTNAVQSPLRWVPTVVINDKYNETENMFAQDNLLQLVCSYLPKNN